jgi:hypothetical protein
MAMTLPVSMNLVCDQCDKHGTVTASTWELGPDDVAAVASPEDLRRDGFVVHGEELICVECYKK